MRLMFCIKQIDNPGGMEKVLIERCNYFIKKDVEIAIVVTDGLSYNSFFYIDNQIKIKNLDINYSQDKEKNIFFRIFNFFFKQQKHKKRLRKFISEYKPDIITSFGNEDKYLLNKINYKCKKILEHHFEKNFLLRKGEKGLHKLKNIYLTKKEEKLLNKYDEFLVLTKEDKEQWNNEKIKVIYNPISFYPEKKASLENKKVISVGRLEYQKGYDILIDVWKKVIEQKKDWILEIYGDGILKKELEEKIQELNLSKNLFLKGKEKNIEKRYLESSIYLMTSRFEGMPMVLLEAQSYGLPIVSFDCPCGPRDIITDSRDGFICKFGDIDTMVKKLIYLMNYEKERKEFGNRARKNVKQFEKEKIMKEWEKLYCL